MRFYNHIVFFLLMFSVFIFQACDEPENSPFHKITFEQKSAIPTPKGRASAVAFSINGKGYVGLGRIYSNTGALTDLWEYTPETDSWTEKKTFPGKARAKAISAVVNGKAYIGLGYAGGTYSSPSYLNDFFSYDPMTDAWEKLAGFPGAGTTGCASFVVGNLIYVAAGYKYISMTNEFWTYNTETDTWKGLNPVPQPYRFGAVACSDGYKAFFGTGFKGVNEDDWWEYFPATDTWKQRRSMPDKGRVDGVALSVSNRFFVTTGRNYNGVLNGGEVFDDIMEYDADKNKWHDRGVVPGGGRENAVSFVIGNKVYIGFGENDTNVLNDMYSFEP